MKLRMLLSCCLFLGACSHTPSQNQPTREKACLVGLKNFDVVVFLSPYFPIDTHEIYQELSSSLGNIGSVSTTKTPSLFESFTQLSKDNPICFFSLTEKSNHLEVSLDVFVDKESLKREKETIQPIWRKKVTAESREGSNNQSPTFASLIGALLEAFRKDYLQANPRLNQTTFHIFECHQVAPESNSTLSF